MNGSSNVTSASTGALSQPLYDNKPQPVDGNSLDQPDALSATTSAAAGSNIIFQASKDYDFPKSTSLTMTQTSDLDSSVFQPYTNAHLHLADGQTDTNKPQENPYDTPSKTVQSSNENSDVNTVPLHNGYLTPKNDENSNRTSSVA